jgi:hypothetical protein
MDQQVGNIFSQFSSDASSVFQELTHIGYLTHTFQWGKYEFTLRTLTIDEEIAVGQLIKHLNQTIGQEKALVAAVMAASLVSVNGKYPFPEVFVEDEIAKLRENYYYISHNWRWPILSKLNEQYLIMQEKMYKSIAEIENLSQEGRSKKLENSVDSSDPSKNHPFLTGEDPTDFV